MANEAVIIELFNGGRPIRFAVQDATAITKDSLLELDAPRRVIVNTNADKPFVGIAAMEKVASDGSLSISAWTDGIFDIVSDSGTDAAGAMMALSATDNVVQTADATDWLQGSYVGHYLEAGTNAGTEAIRVNR